MHPQGEGRAVGTADTVQAALASRWGAVIRESTLSGKSVMEEVGVPSFLRRGIISLSSQLLASAPDE